MLSVKAIYDDKNLKFDEQIKINSPQEVIVTFLDESEEEHHTASMQGIAMKGGAFAFLENQEEDIYTVEDLKVKY